MSDYLKVRTEIFYKGTIYVTDINDLVYTSYGLRASINPKTAPISSFRQVKDSELVRLVLEEEGRQNGK